MAAYLIDYPPIRQQFYATRNRPLTGCTVLHTAESVMDTVGPDTGAEAVAEFIRTRSTPGSYHDLADSDSYVTVVPYESAAFHDGTGSNNWALSISFACRTTDWRQMTPQRRAGFLRQGARAFAAQQAWRKARGHPLTELRYITKAQSDAGVSGFIEHGRRDPGRRTDPGINPPNLFPYDEWLDHCRAALAGTDLGDDDMAYSDWPKADRDRLLIEIQRYAVQPEVIARRDDLTAYLESRFAELRALATGQTPDVDEEALAVALAPLLAEHVGALADADLDRIAQRVADEQSRRLGS